MEFIELDIAELIQKLDKLSENTKPNWGEMSAQRMVEHLTDTLKMASGKITFPMEIEEEKLEKMSRYLASDMPLTKNVAVGFSPKDTPLRHEEIELAIDEFLLEWIDFEEHYSTDERKTENHPYYGPLQYEQWCRLHAKHFTHHFEQFGLL